VRSRSILEKQNYRSQQKLDISSLQFSLQERMLMKELFAFEQILVDAMKSCTPHTLALYAYNLTKSFNALYNEINIQNETNPSKKYFLLELVSLFGDTLKESFSIL
jgi:arginyl-tRNA synthetase